MDSRSMELELRLGPPGITDTAAAGKVNNRHPSKGEEEFQKQQQQQKESILSLGGNFCHVNGWNNQKNQTSSSPMAELQAADMKKKTLLSSSQPKTTTPVPNTTTNSSQKRTAPAPVVGWPPIRSFRKNIASTSYAKQSPEPPPNEAAPMQKPAAAREKMVESCHRAQGMFVKINMDGVPIGRKVDLKAYDTYEKLSSAVDELFRGLLAAQSDSCGEGYKEEEKAITGLLDGSGEYTLVYEDTEGDRMLVGDVPWHMFVSTVKRLRVLKSSELSALCLGNRQDKLRL